MKTTKFRIYDKQNKKIIQSGATPSMLKSFFKHTAVFHTKDKMPYLQFTGLLDKNGKEIYEGDILEVKFNRCIWRYEVRVRKEWANNIFYETVWRNFRNIDGSDTDEFGSYYVSCEGTGNILSSHSMEIVGNIYENPELVKRK